MHLSLPHVLETRNRKCAIALGYQSLTMQLLGQIKVQHEDATTLVIKWVVIYAPR